LFAIEISSLCKLSSNLDARILSQAIFKLA